MKYTIHIKAEITEEQVKKVIKDRGWLPDVDNIAIILAFFDVFNFQNICSRGTGKVDIGDPQGPYFEAYLEKTVKELI